MSKDSFEYEPWVEKCLTCKHAYRTKADAEELRCRCRKGCNYEPYKQRESSRDFCSNAVERREESEVEK